MILFHPFLWPILLIGLSLIVAIVTAMDLPSRWRKSSRASAPPDQQEGQKRTIPVDVRIVRNSGVFWLVAGVVTIAHGLTPEMWKQPGSVLGLLVGLFWMVLGTQLVRSTFPRQKPRRSPDGKRVPLSKIVAEIAERACRAGHVGLVVGVVSGNEESLCEFGTTSTGGKQPPDSDTLFEIGSITKVFTGIVLARLVETGELKLDDRIADLLPDGWTLPEAARSITLRHCTTHTSGLPRLPANLLTFADGLRVMIRGGDPYRNYSEEQLRQALATVQLNHEPGTKYEYSNLGVGLLGYILARQAGSTYESLVVDRICRPLGMYATVITLDEATSPRLACGYRMSFRLGSIRFGLRSDEWRIPDPLAGAGAIRSSGRDMLKFLKANMDLISTVLHNAIATSHQELFRDTDVQAIGMNWIRSFDDELGQDIIWHNGGTGGFRSYLGFTADRQMGVFVLGNTANSVNEVALDILKSLAPVRVAESTASLSTTIPTDIAAPGMLIEPPDPATVS